MNYCPDIASWEELAEGRCDGDQTRQLHDHLKACPDCLATFDSINRNARLLGELKGAWVTPAGGPPIGALTVGMRIGGYEISGLLGTGGMACVYRATQNQPHRTVALKLMKVGLGSPAAFRRFEHEAELLGRLQHPGIAHVYEAGVAEVAGHQQPFFAMELIEGDKLNEHATRRELSTRQRMELIAGVGEAVHYAHQKGIIHRDLKPSNILIDGSGQPKILDFGVARATETDVQVTTLHTDVGQLIGTIPYMSPEQASGDSRDVDVRSDVYSLGVVCYELLAGRLPYSIKDKTVPQAVRVIQEDDPTPLSSINRVFRGDLETMIGKALEKDKERRYPSVSDFVADIRRYLRDEPITARPPTAAYQFSKFARRNRALVGGVMAVFVALVLGLAGTGYGWNRAVKAEHAARTGRDQAESVIALLKQMLSSADPEEVKGADYTVRQLLDEYDQGLKGKSIGQPEVEAAVRSTIGNAYLGLGLREQAERQLKAALDLRRQVHGPEHPEVARALCDYAWYLRHNADFLQAEHVLRDALSMQRKLLGTKHVEIATTLTRLADAQRNNDRLKSAEQSAREALDMRRQLLGGQHPDVAQDLNTLGWVLRDTARSDQAIQSFTESIALLRSLYGNQHPLLADSLYGLARTRADRGEIESALSTFQEALDVARRSLGDQHHDFGEVVGAYGLYLATIGRYEEAEAPLVDALAISRAAHGNWHTCVASYQHQLGRLYLWSGRAELAEPLFRQSVAINADLRGKEHQWTLSLHLLQADALIALQKYEEALALAQPVVAHYTRQFGERDSATASAKRTAGLALLRRGDAALAEPMLREAVEVLRRTPGQVPWRPATAESALGECLVALQRYDEAEPLLRQSYEWLKSNKGERFYETTAALSRVEKLHEAQRLAGENGSDLAITEGPTSP